MFSGLEAPVNVAEEASISLCVRRWVRLLRSCGCHQIVPVRCGDLFCRDCGRVWRADAVERWLPAFLAMKTPRMLTLTIKSGWDIKERERFENASFRRFLDIRLGPRNWDKFYAAALSYLNKSDPRYQNAVKQLSRLRVTLLNYRQSHGRWPRVREMLRQGISGRESTWSDEFGYHLHRHVVFDGVYIPQCFWLVLWQEATGGQGLVVDIRKRDKTLSGLQEAISYFGKVTGIPESRRDEFRAAFRHVKRIWRIGDIEPSIPGPSLCPECGQPECSVVPDSVMVGDTIQYEPDGGVIVRFGLSTYVMLRRVDGRWLEEWSVDNSLNLIPQELTWHSPGASGPDPPLLFPLPPLYFE